MWFWQKSKTYFFVSGFGEDESNWEPLIESLKNKSTVVVATPGFGTVPPLPKLTQESFNEFILAKVVEFNLADKEIVFVGHSLGAVLLLGALPVLRNFRSQFVLMSFAYKSEYLAFDAKIILTAVAKQGIDNLQKAQEVLKNRGEFVDGIYKLFRDVIDKDLAQVDRIFGHEALLDSYAKAFPQAIRDGAELLINFDYTNLLKTSDKKILIIQGNKDKRINSKSCADFEISNPKIQAIWIEEMTHGGYVIMAKTVAKIIQKYL